MTDSAHSDNDPLITGDSGPLVTAHWLTLASAIKLLTFVSSPELSEPGAGVQYTGECWRPGPGVCSDHGCVLMIRDSGLLHSIYPTEQ